MLTWKKNQAYLKHTKSYSDLVRLLHLWFCRSNPNATGTKFITVLLTNLFSPHFTCNLNRLSYCCPNPRYSWVPHPSILVFMHLCFYQLSRKHQISTTAALFRSVMVKTLSSWNVEVTHLICSIVLRLTLKYPAYKKYIFVLK